MKSIGIKTFIEKLKFTKGTFVYFIFLNAKMFEKFVTGNIIIFTRQGHSRRILPRSIAARL